MKKLSQILAVVAIVLAPFAASNTAYALGTCEIEYTGPNSDNLCVSERTYTCSYNNVNKIVFINDSDQTTISGDALVEENTQGGTSTTGSATNDNDVTFDVTVINKNDIETCTVVASVPATPVTPAAPVTPAGGKGQVTAPVKKSPAILASTSGDATSNYLVFFAAALGIGAVVSYSATMIYRRQQS